MRFTGELTVDAPRPAVYAAIRDARFFASCVAGVRDLVEIAPDRYSAVLETKVAYMKFTFKVTVEVVDAQAPDRIEAKVEGTPLGVVGRMTATSVTTLSDAPEGTRINYDVDAVLTGKLGSLGQPVLRAKAREMERQFAARLAAAFAGGSKEVTTERS
jgi:carbon monoxide dehydrogenase subunit G